MTPHQFDMKLDWGQMASWYEDWGLDVPEKEFFPETGYVVDEVAAGFLYKTDSGLAMVESYISNPHISKELRGKALDSITEMLIDSARICGFKFVMAVSSIEAIINRAVIHGFKECQSNCKILMRGV